MKPITKNEIILALQESRAMREKINQMLDAQDSRLERLLPDGEMELRQKRIARADWKGFMSEK